MRQAAVEVEGRQSIGPPKTPGSIRDVRIGPRLAAVLDERAAVRASKGRRFLFGRDPTTALRPKSLADLWTRIHIRAGIPRRGAPHTARHTHASQLLRDGVLLPEVWRRLGRTRCALAMVAWEIGAYLLGI